MIEVWKQVPDCPRYEVSSFGRLRGFDPRLKKVTMRGQSISSHGYFCVNLQRASGRRQCEPVHSLVCRTFHGPRPFGMDCCHNDGNKYNNQAINLRWDTRQENFNDQKRHGTFAWHGRPKLTKDQVLEIVQRIDSGEKISDLAKEFNVFHGVISGINNGCYWADVTGRSKQDAFPAVSKKSRSLNKESVMKIIDLIDDGYSQESIAAAFGVTSQNISDINRGKLWGWLTGRTKDTARAPNRKGTAKQYIHVVGVT